MNNIGSSGTAQDIKGQIEAGISMIEKLNNTTGLKIKKDLIIVLQESDDVENLKSFLKYVNNELEALKKLY